MALQDRVHEAVAESHMQLVSPPQVPALVYRIKHRLTHVALTNRSHQSFAEHSFTDEIEQAFRHCAVDDWNVHSESPWQVLAEVRREHRTLQPPLYQLHSGSATHWLDVL